MRTIVIRNSSDLKGKSTRCKSLPPFTFCVVPPITNYDSRITGVLIGPRLQKNYNCDIIYIMKKRLSLVFVLAISLLLILPSVSYSRHYRYYRGCGGCCNGWGVGAAIAGGVIVGAVVGNIIAQSAYSSRPQRVYYAPRPNVAYAYPDPEFVARYSQKRSPGEWVTVPGQSVGGKWVPAHKVWVPSQTR